MKTCAWAFSSPEMQAMFNLIGYGERTCSDVPDIYSVWQEAGYVEPTVKKQFGTGQPNRTVVTLPLVEKELENHHQDHHQGGNSGGDKGVDWSERSEGIIRLIKEDPTVSTTKISEKMALTRRQVERTLDVMKASGRIHREGTARKGRWIIND